MASTHSFKWRYRLSSTFAWWLLASATAMADIDIDIRGVAEEEIRANILVYLSVERYRTSDALSQEVLERLHERVDREVKAALRPFGYYAPKVNSTLTATSNSNWRVVINIDTGKPIIMENITIAVQGPGANDPLFATLASNPPLREGDRLSHAAYEKIKGDLQRTAATYGYLDAKLLRNELRVDPARHTASVALEFVTGERYRFGVTTIDQTAIDEPLVRRYMRYQENQPFDLTQVLRTQFALDDSQYFTNVEVLPQEADRKDLSIPVSLRADANRRNRYSVGVGYGTDTQERGTLTWEDRRVNRRGHRLTMELQGAVINQTARGRYLIPIGDPALEKLTLELTSESRKQTDLVETTTTEFKPSITQVRDRWQMVWFVSATRVTTEETLLTLDTPAGTESVRSDVARLLIPGVNLASIPQGYLGEALFSRGFFAELRGSHNVFGSDEDFLQLRIQAERVFDLNPQWHVLLRGDVGASLVGELSQLPGTLRFFAGGDRSVRGFGYNDLSPVSRESVEDEDGNLVLQEIKAGGKHLFTGTVELIRDLPRNLGVAAFVDAGNAFDRFGDSLEYSAGIGIRFRTPVVTFGIDIAQPLSQSDAGPRLHINFSPKL